MSYNAFAKFCIFYVFVILFCFYLYFGYLLYLKKAILKVDLDGLYKEKYIYNQNRERR